MPKAKDLDKKMLSLRVSKDLYEKLARLAELERRTVHNLLLIIVEDAIDDRLKKAAESR